jgi:ribose transport system ATP-binding protein
MFEIRGLTQVSIPGVATVQPILEVRGISKSFGRVVALSSANVTVRAGEQHGIMGANGAGKSTLVKILTGIVIPDGGTISVAGQIRVIRSPSEARRAGLATVYQETSLIPDLTLEQNLRLTGTPLGAMWRLIAQLGLPGVDAHALVRELPLATLRIVDLARALAADPQVLILDEMTAALPADLTEMVFRMLGQWRESGRSLVFISHRLADVSAICDRVTVLRDGVTAGVVEPVKGNEEEIVALMLGNASQPGSAAGTSVRERRETSREVVLEARNLQVGSMLRDVSLEVRRGEVVGVAALEGQGQEQLFECLAGVRRPDRGQIVVEGKVRAFRSPQDAIEEGVVLIPADRAQALLRLRSIEENVALPMVRKLRRWGLVNAARERRLVDGAVRRLQIDTRAQSEVSRLSGGNQQKVTIARWIASGFSTLLCLDPTRGIDIGTKRQIYDLIRELAGKGTAVLIYTSELSEIQLVCDRVIVVFDGSVVAEMPGQVADEKTLLHAAHGLASEPVSGSDGVV